MFKKVQSIVIFHRSIELYRDDMKTTRRRRPTLKAFLLGLGLGFGATLTTTMALETECDVCHVNYFHKVYII